MGLEHCAILDRLSDDECALIASLGHEVTFTAGETIIADHSQGDGFFVLLDGRVEVRKEGVRVTELDHGAILGEMSLFNHHRREGEVRSLTSTTLLEIKTAEFMKHVLHHESAAVKVMAELGKLMVERMQVRDTRLVELGRRNDPSIRSTVDSFQVVKQRMMADWALKYHALGRPGKLAITATKATGTAADLSVAYSPGVAEPCLEIAKRPDSVYEYTTKGQLVGVITNGTAVLGLGDIGPHAAKPVMEGKAVLFKRFADLDALDIELDEKDPARLIDIVCALAPTFGGINLEDIRAPECFEIERECQRRLEIPVFHDDQHGTAIIAGAGLLNALDLVGKSIDGVRVVFSGAGAAGFSCARFFVDLGVERDNLILTDVKGVVYRGRGDDNYLDALAADTAARTLTDAIVDADVFVGVSAGGLLKPEMLRTMARDPIVFALANPTPEIDFGVARATRDDVIVATGRSDYPNQVNNVIAFPYIFRGALDARARAIDSGMKRAASRAIAALAREPITAAAGFSSSGIEFGRDYLVPKPFDRRLLPRLSSAVAEAAMQSGLARVELDLVEYREELERLATQG